MNWHPQLTDVQRRLFDSDQAVYLIRCPAHRCRERLDSVLFTLAHALCEGGETLKVLTGLTAEEFHEYARHADPQCKLEGDFVSGRLHGFDWKVKITTMKKI